MLRIEVDCGEGREFLRMRVVMAGNAARALGARIAAGATVKVTGSLRAARRRPLPPIAGEIEVWATEISEIVAVEGS